MFVKHENRSHYGVANLDTPKSHLGDAARNRKRVNTFSSMQNRFKSYICLDACGAWWCNASETESGTLHLAQENNRLNDAIEIVVTQQKQENALWCPEQNPRTLPLIWRPRLWAQHVKITRFAKQCQRRSRFCPSNVWVVKYTAYRYYVHYSRDITLTHVQHGIIPQRRVAKWIHACTNAVLTLDNSPSRCFWSCYNTQTKQQRAELSQARSNLSQNMKRIIFKDRHLGTRCAFKHAHFHLEIPTKHYVDSCCPRKQNRKAYQHHPLSVYTSVWTINLICWKCKIFRCTFRNMWRYNIA